MKLKINLPFKKINSFKLFPWALLVIIILMTLFFANFLNKNYFLMKKNIDQINKLSNEVSPVVVEINTYHQILENLENKKNQEILNIGPNNLRNPFQDIIKENIR